MHLSAGVIFHSPQPPLLKVPQHNLPKFRRLPRGSLRRIQQFKSDGLFPAFFVRFIERISQPNQQRAALRQISHRLNVKPLLFGGQFLTLFFRQFRLHLNGLLQIQKLCLRISQQLFNQRLARISKRFNAHRPLRWVVSDFCRKEPIPAQPHLAVFVASVRCNPVNRLINPGRRLNIRLRKSALYCQKFA